MKMIMRADDVGYTNIHDLATWETIEHGIATSADLMLDTPGSEEAMRRLRCYPWISVGWHIHFWGKPVLPTEQVPSLVGENGKFKTDIRQNPDVDPKEALAEFRAQMDRCLTIMGRVPDYCATVPRGSLLEAPVRCICEEYGIATDLFKDMFALSGSFKSPLGPSPIDPKWVDRKIIAPALDLAFHLMSDDWDTVESYDPIPYFVEDRGHLLDFQEDETLLIVWHPGYIDHYVQKEGDSSPVNRGFITCLPKDMHALCSSELREWVEKNNIELVNFRDALYGTKEYQNHLKVQIK